MDSNNISINDIDIDIKQNKNRGDILYYSISQVAALLGQEDSMIRYYTNIFDNILKIEIFNKEFRYTSKDIDKLEFLINLKNKDMSIKEIQNYCESLPLNLEEIIEIKENNSLSLKEIITTIIGLENKEIANLKNSLIDIIGDSNKNFVKQIVASINDKQKNDLDILKNYILDELKKYIDSKFVSNLQMTTDMINELSSKIDALISNKNSLENNVQSELQKYNEINISRDKNLLDEIKRFEKIIERAYYIQQDMENEKHNNTNFIFKLLGIR